MGLGGIYSKPLNYGVSIVGGCVASLLFYVCAMYTSILNSDVIESHKVENINNICNLNY